MKHLCEQLIESARYLESAGLSRQQLSQLHHFSRRGGTVGFAETYAYFGVNKELRRTNQAFAERLKYIATEHKRSGRSLSALVRQALSQWPL
jgi:hypothetical protein